MFKLSKSVLAIILGLVVIQSLHADPVVSGSSSGNCTTEVLSAEPFKVNAPIPTKISEPATCADYSGTWQGGCYWAVVKPVLFSPSGLPIFTAETTLPEYVWTKANLESEPTLVPKHTMRIVQHGCNQIQFEAPNGSPVEGTVADFTRDFTYSRSQTFSRACVAGNSSWMRTYEMNLIGKLSSRWSSSNQTFSLQINLDGLDSKYGARYQGIERTRFTVKGGELRMDTAIWMLRDKYDPPAFNFDPPDVNGRICTFKKLP